jgi:hypothetical protein
MARSLSSNIQTQITQEGIRVVHLLKLETSTAIKATNHVKDLIFSSDTYQAGGEFLGIEAVQETGNLEYTNINVSLNNVTTSVRDIFTAGNYVNKAATVYVAFLDTDETILDAYEYFKGSITACNIDESKSSFAINIELASHFKNWDIKKGRRYTQASQEEFITKKIADGVLSSGTTDKGLEFAHQANKDVRWNR